MKLPESTASTRSAGSRRSSSRLRTRGRSSPRWRCRRSGRRSTGPRPRSGRRSAPAVATLRVPHQHQLIHRAGGLADVAVHAQIDRPVRAERRLVVVDLDQGRPVADQPAVPGGPHGQTATPGDDQIRVRDQLGRQRGGEAAGDAEIEGVASECALRHRRGGQQRTRSQRQVAERLAVRHGAPPGDEHRPLGRVASGRPAGGSRTCRAGPAPAAGAGSPGPASASPACTSSGTLSTTVRRPLRAVRHARVTSATALSAEYTRSGTAPTERTRPSWSILKLDRTAAPGGVRGQHDHRRPALGGLGDTGDGIGQSRSLVHRHQADRAARARVRVGHRGRTRLVPGREERDPGLAQRVRHDQVAAADHAEGVADAEATQGPSDQLGDSHPRSSAPLDQRDGAGRAARAAHDR